jgi:hypothetical protein
MTLNNLSKILDKYEQQVGYGSSSIQQFELLNIPTADNYEVTSYLPSLGTLKKMAVELWRK